MQGVFAPPSPTGTKRDLDALPRAAPLGAPLVDWEEVTAVPDTEHGTGHEELPTFLVYSPLPNFKLGEYHFFIVPKGTSSTRTIRKSSKYYWTVAYVEQKIGSHTWAVPFTSLHESKIEKLRSLENKRITEEYTKTKKVYETANAKKKMLTKKKKTKCTSSI